MGISGEGVAYQNGVALLPVQAAVGLVGHANVIEPVSVLQHYFSGDSITLGLNQADRLSLHLAIRSNA
jgi:hypothetical protein